MRTRTLSIGFPLLLVSVLLLAACYPPAKPVPATGQAAQAEMGSSLSLVGPNWVLTTLNDEPILPEIYINAQFGTDGSVGGTSGCNRYNAPYEVDGSSLAIGMAATTMMACPSPVMEQEIAYQAALGATRSYEINGEILSLKDETGATIAQFNAESNELAGTSWDVISYNNGKEAVVSVIIGTEITANFGEDGELAGNAGCNDYFGPYETEGDAISMGPFGETRKACQEAEGIMEQESRYLAALETAASYQIEGSQMEMRTAEGARVATFQRTTLP